MTTPPQPRLPCDDCGQCSGVKRKDMDDAVLCNDCYNIKRAVKLGRSRKHRRSRGEKGE